MNSELWGCNTLQNREKQRNIAYAQRTKPQKAADTKSEKQDTILLRLQSVQRPGYLPIWQHHGPSTVKLE